MEPLVAQFKGVCTAPWNDETIRKMIEKHGLEVSIGIALDGGVPDVLPDNPGVLTAVQNNSTRSPPFSPVRTQVGEVVENEPKLPPLVHVISDPEPFQALSAVDRSVGEEDEQLASALRQKVGNRNLDLFSVISDDEPDLPSSQITIASETTEDDHLVTDSLFSVPMTRLDVENSRSGAREMDIHLSSPTNRNQRAPVPAEEIAPAPKRQATVLIEPFENPVPGPAPPTVLSSPPSEMRAPAAITQLARVYSETELAYLKTFETPPRPSDLPPHAFGRLRSLQHPPSGAEGAQHGNIAHYLQMSQEQAGPQLYSKSVRTKMNELLMIVDSDFAYSPLGGPVMDALYAANIPIVAAKLPCRNTIIFRRIGNEFDVQSMTVVPPSELGDENAINSDGHPFNLEDLDTEPEKAIHALPSISNFKTELDHVILVLTPHQLVQAKDNDLKCAFIDETKLLNPGKTVSVLILHASQKFKYPGLTNLDASLLLIQMQLKHALQNVIPANATNTVHLAELLGHIHRTLSLRPYDFLSLDGPFFSFDPGAIENGGARDCHGAFTAMLQATGMSQQPVRAICGAHGNPLNLFSTLSGLPNPDAQVDYISKLPKETGQRLGPDFAAHILPSFAPQVHSIPPYKPLLK